MAELTIDDLRFWLDPLQGKEVDLPTIRKELRLNPDGTSWDGVRVMMFRLAEQHIVKPVGKKQGVYLVLKRVTPVSVFGAEHRNETFPLVFPRDQLTDMAFPFAEDVVIRSGDLILIAGVSNYGKTTIAMNFLAENLDSHPVLLGNEFTTADGKPTPRFVNRLQAMDWVSWTNGNGDDRFMLLPVMSEFAEYVQKDKVNIIDWINIETGEHYLINGILYDIKRNVGGGVAIAVIQKSELSETGRGGQFTKDFADLELLIDKHTETESRITVGKCKESTKRVTGRSWAFSISQGVKITNVREVKKCKACWGKGFTSRGKCDNCVGVGFVDA